jgi:hypothetical protein
MGFWDNLFGGKKTNPANAAMPYLNQIPGQTGGYLNPYINAGQQSLPQLQGEYGGLLNDPGGKLNKIGQSYQQSPGFQFALQQALGGAGNAAAAGGMAGSPQHEMQNMGIATGLANQDYNNWLQQATGMYNEGLHGQQGMSQQGLQAGTSMSDMIAQQLAQQANLAFQGQTQQNQNRNDMWGNIGRGVGALSAFTPWRGLGQAAQGALGGYR